MKFAVLIALLLVVLASGCEAVPCAPSQGLQACVNQADEGGPVIAKAGNWGDQSFSSNGRVLIAEDGARFGSIDVSGSNTLLSGFDIDAGGRAQLGLHISGDNIGFHNGSVGNVHNEKGALVSGENITIDHTYFHDVTVDEGIHNECLYAIVVPGLTLKDNTFRECATFDVFFTYGFWWTPLPPAYGDITMLGNDFGVTRKADGTPHYYSVMAAYTGNGPIFSQCGGASEPQGYLTNWLIKFNIFRLPTAYITDCTARWRGVTWESNTGG